jgi:DNA polymerase-4
MGLVRTEPSILHMDLDAFFAAVEQRDKPSLRGKPVVVGGLGPRGVVATASYEARVFGVQSAMPMSQARARCPNAAYLYPRFGVYQRTSAHVLDVLRRYSPLIEPLSLDEAFADLTAGEHADLSEPGVRQIAGDLKAEITAETQLTASVGAATSKFMAKLASDLDKPDGLRVVPPGRERELLRPLPVTKLWGVGPATAIRLHTAGIHTIEELERLTLEELTGLLGQAWGGQLYRLARADDERSVLAERETKSISVEETFDRDILDLGRLHGYLEMMTTRLVRRLEREGLSGRTITIKVRLYDFTTLSRSATQPGPTNQVRTVTRVAKRLLDEIDVTGGVRLLGVGLSGLADWTQGDLFDWEPAGSAGEPDRPQEPVEPVEQPTEAGRAVPDWRAGQDVWHAEHGPGWVWGTGRGLVTVRFETADRPDGPVLTFAADDSELVPAEPFSSSPDETYPA